MDIYGINYNDYLNYFQNNENIYENEYKYGSGNYESFSNPNNLMEAFKSCRKDVNWKDSVQRYGINELKNTMNLHQQIENETYKEDPIHEFTLAERGHIRDIKAHTVKDRVVQRSFNDNVLLPRIRNQLIYDNGASLKNKGISFSRNRFEIHLRSAYQEFNGEFYVLLIDFSKFFDNILHQQLLNMFQCYLNEYEFKFLTQFIHEFEIDVSYMSDEEFDSSLNILFNSLEYSKIKNKYDLDGSKMLRKSVGIGNQISQISGLYYPHEIDNYCKICKSIKYYGRYMDDSYIFLKTKEELHALLKEINEICIKLGIFVNFNKTKIIKSSNIIPYLKINYKFKDTGGLIRIISSETIRREYRKITKYKNLLDNGKCNLNDIVNWYKSWRGNYIKYDSKSKIYKLDFYMINLFNLDKDFIKK